MVGYSRTTLALSFIAFISVVGWSVSVEARPGLQVVRIGVDPFGEFANNTDRKRVTVVLFGASDVYVDDATKLRFGRDFSKRVPAVKLFPPYDIDGDGFDDQLLEVDAKSWRTEVKACLSGRVGGAPFIGCQENHALLGTTLDCSADQCVKTTRVSGWSAKDLTFKCSGGEFNFVVVWNLLSGGTAVCLPPTGTQGISAGCVNASPSSTTVTFGMLCG